MKIGQIFKVFKVCLVATIFLLLFEIVFSIKGVVDFFSGMITSSNGVWVYISIWIIMFLQCTILNIPALAILSLSVNIGIDVLGWKYLAVVILAYMCGCILAYWLGRWFGTKAVRWCAGSEEDFDKWSSYLNTKGKKWYFLTILLPIFPDDILCLVAGATHFKFRTYVVYNLIGRSVGLITMLLTLKLIGLVGGDFPFMLLLWSVALVGEIIGLIIIKRKISSINGQND